MNHFSRQILSVFAGLGLLALAVSYLLFFQAQDSSTTVADSVAVKRVSIGVIPIDASKNKVAVHSSGLIEAGRTSQVNSRIAGYIESVSESLVLGKKVRKGEKLLSLDTLEVRVALAEAKLALADAKTRLVEEQGRHKQAKSDIVAISRANKASAFAKRIPQLQAAQADFNAKQAAVEKAKKELAFSQILSPFDGTILAKSVNVAEFIDTEKVLFTLADHHQLKLIAPITLDQWQLISPQDLPGTEVSIVVEKLSSQPIKGTIKQLIPEIDSQTGDL